MMKLLRSPSFSLRSRKASALDHFAPINLIYSVQVELHDRSKRCTSFSRPTRIDYSSLRNPVE
jgi:hypothetical protein